MAPAVYYIDPSDAPDGDGMIALTGDEARHAAQVARVRVGETVDLVDGQGRRLAGEVTAVARDRVDVRIDHVTTEVAPSPRVVVVQALAKGDRGEQAVAAMTEVGVDVIVPWAAEHCVTRWVGERAERGVAKWRTSARAAAKQARRSRVPDVLDLYSTGDVESLVADADLALSLDESADEPLAGVSVPHDGTIVLVVGPEGGFSEAERARLRDAGARPTRLGPSVLRTSTAGPVGAAVALSRTPRWGAPA